MILIMTLKSRHLALAVALALGLAACGTDADAGTEAASAATTTTAEADHDEDHSDEDHADEDHDDEDHSDEDHDDHDDEDHTDEDDHDHDDEASGGLGAHEHGTAELSVVWVDSEVVVDLISPNFNVFGFEYEPETDEDIATEADRLDALVAPGVLTLNDEAGCTLADTADTEIERDGSHSEITVSWVFNCENADEISELDASQLFAEFPGFEDIDAQWISPTEQSAGELTPSSTTLSLQG